jgi:phosphatidylethanolamine/phosphatidyl-N-methylethanolamine N-methyltransferase
MPVTESSSSYPGFAARAKSVFTTWLENPAQVASVVPSSSALTDEIADRSYVREATCIVDLGPGTGETTEALLKHMRNDAKLLAIEKTKEFVEPLSKINDHRLVVSQGDAIDLGQYLSQIGRREADVVVSGIPFSSVSPKDAIAIIDAIHRALSPGGYFVAYQFLNNIEAYVRPKFGKGQVKRVWRNIPPLRVYTWVK